MGRGPVLSPRPTPGRRWAAACGLLAALAAVPAAAESFLGRPIYGEPGIGLKMPPGCRVDASGRSRLGGTDFEVWAVDCRDGAHAWLLRRQVIEVLSSRLARLRFTVMDERVLPGERAGDTVSVQCTGHDNDDGYVVLGARWRADGRTLRLVAQRGLLRADAVHGRFADADPRAADCVRFPEREELMRKLRPVAPAPAP